MIPKITALLTTHNRAHLLPRVLRGLADQRLENSRFEIIAIDDGSTDSTPEVLAAWQECLPLRVIHKNHAGLAAAKNLGIFFAQSPIIVFLDDDDVPEPDLLLAHLAAHIANPDPHIAVLGRTTLALDVATPIMKHVTEVGCQLFSYGGLQRCQLLDYTYFWGGRSSCKRSFLVKNGVFQPDFHFGCEDIELAWRLNEMGLKVIYEPKACSVMIRSLTFDEFCTRSYRQGRSQHRFAALHQSPDIRLYCEIDVAMESWHNKRHAYEAHLDWTRKMDRLATVWLENNIALTSSFQQALDDAYRQAFFLSRAKGIVEASSGD